MSRKRFTWLPTLGSAPTGLGESHTLNGRTLATTVVANSNLGSGGQITTGIFPLVPDAPLEPTDAAEATLKGGLQLALGNEWFLERIVGSIFCGFNPSSEAENGIAAVLCGAGFFVARANDEDSGGGVNTPIGSASVAERNPNYSPLHDDTGRQPWIWRRTWMLGGAPNNGDRGGFTFFPTTNAFYGDVRSGPHVDAKSVRRIHQDERLWIAVATCAIQPRAGQTLNATVDWYTDLRILGQMRRARGQSNF